LLKWYKENSVPSKDSQEKYNVLSEKLKNVRKKLVEEKSKDAALIDPDKIQYLEGEQSSLKSLMDKMY